jgi:mannosyltransferase OCH1-like enzyme
MVNLNPCYSDERAFLFVRDRFPREVLHAYCALIPGAFRADLLRLCLLYEFGGLYPDVSNTALVNFWREIPAEAEYILVREIWPNQSGIHNAFVFVRNPKSHLVQQAIDDVVRNVRARQKGILNVTGPIVLGQSVRKFMNLVPTADFSRLLQPAEKSPSGSCATTLERTVTSTRPGNW